MDTEALLTSGHVHHTYLLQKYSQQYNIIIKNKRLRVPYTLFEGYLADFLLSVFCYATISYVISSLSPHSLAQR